MQTIQQLLFDAVKYEERLLAHAVFLAVQEGLVKMEDDASEFDFERLDLEKVQQMTASNMLAMSPIKLFTVPLEPGCFAFILAKNEKDAAGEFRRQYNRAPRKVLDVSDQMDRSLYFEERNKHQSFRDIKSQVQDFPYFVCEFEKYRRASA